VEVSELDPEKFYVVSINPETAPEPETAARLLDQLHEAGISCLVLVGDARITEGDAEYLEAARRAIDLDTPLTDEERIHLGTLLTSAATEEQQ
jgi:hypothetical protein